VFEFREEQIRKEKENVADRLLVASASQRRELSFELDASCTKQVRGDERPSKEPLREEQIEHRTKPVDARDMRAR